MKQNTWSEQQINSINKITKDFTTKQFKKYHINWLKRLIAKIDFYQPNCSKCVDLKTTVDQLITELQRLKNDVTHDDQTYQELQKLLYQHLKKDHKVVDSRHYMSWGVVIGVIFGIMVTLLLQSLVPEAVKYGMYIGVITGFVIGLLLDKKAVREERIL